MDSNIVISVLLPAYNAHETLSKSIESVLNQSVKNFELIIINDGSTDNTEKVVQGYHDSRIVYVKNDINIGLIKTLNKGVLLSKGKYIARIDADDIWTDKEKLAKQLDFLEKHPDYVLVGTQATLRRENEITRTKYPLSDRDIRNTILSKCVFIHSSVLIRKSVLDDDPYENNYLVEDYSLWLQIGLKGKFANLHDYCVEYLTNQNGETYGKKLQHTVSSFALIKKYKNRYPNFYTGYLIWTLKVYVRKLLFYFK